MSQPGSQTGSSTRYCSRCLSTFEQDQPCCPNLACRRERPAVGWGRMFGPGDVFDRHYRIHNLLALGGAGVTYLAREVDNDGAEQGPRLAVKVLFASRDEGPYLRRLATEAQVIQELDHPNIVQYLGFVHRAGHSPYLVTRFEAGGSLLDHIKRVGSMSVRRTAHVARQVCWALDKAHSMGVVHRDMKPENVLLSRVVGADEDPVIRVADFGIAKVQGALSSVTRVGAFVGTPQYAAPEQFIGGAPAPATDVYGVGALIYFCTMVMSVVRFADRLDPADSYQLLVDSLPPTIVRAHDDADDVRRLNTILEVCMDPQPGRRCTAEQLDGLLGALLAGHEPDVDSVRAPEHSSSATLAVEPDTLERLREQESPAPIRQMVGPGPGEVEPSPTADIETVAPPAVAPPAVPPPAVAPPDPDGPPPRSRSILSVLALVGLLTGSGVVAGWSVLAWRAPARLPAAVRLAPVALHADSAADAATSLALQQSLADRLPALRSRCGVDSGHVSATLVIEPAGQVRSIALTEVSAGLDGQCAGELLSEGRLPSPGWRPVRVSLSLDL